MSCRRLWLTIAIVALLLSLAGVTAVWAGESGSGGLARGVAWQQKPVAKMLVFYSQTCSHCQVIVNDFLPPLKDKYGAQLDYTLIEITNPVNLQALVTLEKAYGVPADRATIPEIFLGRDVFLGEDSTKQDLEKTLKKYLSEGGVDFTAPMKQALATAQKQSVVVQAVMFFMPTCSHCEQVIQQVLPLLKQRYAEQFQLVLVDVTSDAAYEKFASYMAARTGSKDLVGVPTMIISDTVMLGSDDIAKSADAAIQGYLAKKGAKFPALPAGLGGTEYQLSSAAAPLTPLPGQTAVRPVPASENAINLAYFFQPGCQECDRVSMALNYMLGRYASLVVTSFDVKEYATLNEWMGARAGVPVQKRLTAPAIFVGQEALIGDGINLDSLELLLAKYKDTGAPKIWEEFTGEQAQTSIIQRFRSLGALTVVGAGLIDGLNPCAFATLIFFISYLTLTGRKGREIFLVGLSFTLGVFLAYLAVGLGLSKLLSTFSFLTQIGKAVYFLTAILCVVLAILSVLDYFKARQGRSDEMSLSLPKVLRKRINAVIREGQEMRAYVPVAFVTGAAVSLIELACTGQVYLPTIIFVLSVPEMRVRAFLYLLLYNICFVIPLIVVFALAYYGTTAAQLTKFLKTHTATIKLGTALLFLALAAWLVYSLLT
jgi:cytochrome c biogenesis protein CcdA/glutaredoxin